LRDELEAKITAEKKLINELEQVKYEKQTIEREHQVKQNKIDDLIAKREELLAKLKEREEFYDS
jgi:hypothetical protein